jgi:hypothetical protein
MLGPATMSPVGIDIRDSSSDGALAATKLTIFPCVTLSISSSVV